MAALLIPPINPNEKTIIDLDQGQQIIIDKDTHWGRVRNRLDDPNPTTAINIEPSGTCWSFTFEDGVWWRSEYIGDARRLPQLQKKVRATEEERIGREQAKREWEERTRGSMPSDPRVPSNTLPQPIDPNPIPEMPSRGWQNEQSFPMPEMANFGHIQQNPPANSFPAPPFFPANTTHHSQNFGPPPVIPHQGWVPPQPPSFPSNFPFDSAPPHSRSPSRGFPMPPSPRPAEPPYHSSWPSQCPMPSPNFQANDGNYVQTSGNTRHSYVNQSASVVGNNNNVIIS